MKLTYCTYKVIFVDFPVMPTLDGRKVDVLHRSSKLHGSQFSGFIVSFKNFAYLYPLCVFCFHGIS